MRTLIFTILAIGAMSIQSASASAVIQDYRARVNTVAGTARQTVNDASALMRDEPRTSPATNFYETPSRR